MSALIVAGMILLIGWYVVAAHNPNVNCPRCKGAGDIRSWFLKSRSHPCPRCKGSGRRG